MAINDPYITPQDTVPTEGPDAESLWTILRSVPDILRDLMTDIETAEFLNSLQQQYQLSFQQRWAVAEFLRDILMGIALPDDTVTALSERAQIRKTTATQMMKEIEVSLLSRAGMTISDIARSVRGPAIREDAGRLLLRYNSVDDLLASIENMSPDERTSFLEDAKIDNRIMVLKALTQLKLGVDRKGRPMTFRQLAVQEAPDFSARDWVDAYTEDASLLVDDDVNKALLSFLGSTENISNLFSAVDTPEMARAFYGVLGHALSRAKPTVTDYVRWSPFFAGLFNKEGAANARLFQFYTELTPEIQQNLVAPELAQSIEDAIRDNVFPKNFGVAVAKIIFMVSVGDLGIETLPTLLSEKLGLGAQQGSVAADRVAALIEVVLSSPGEETLEAVPEEETAEDFSENRSANDAQNANIDTRANVVDLRKKTSEG